ncbi:hypothetical protein L9W73_17605 [Vibrio aestuarianus]|jgi:hypothetical protein|uniref:Uncharacterized protein n=1 Tax=Vibrio aestuarianus TaxID=28171 RepID=A0A9X4FHX9_9VIBR|nr:hypothetical protein [Vibrio aestuarianus]MDE1312616.1 hypothetical protein [Vibrio aestuarianus]MDE1359092.1 hypothetical protein [Vibrio aestuarianus]NGZ93917.1 hypothetical protein [Vibrio aestuarianus subsp. cardii]
MTTFVGTELKIVRAKSHIRELENQLVDYIKSKPFKVVVESEDGGSNHLWTLRVKHDIPMIFAAIIGDVIHNLRASLDLLATELVEHAGQDAKNVYFPFGNDADGLEQMIKKRRIDKAGQGVVDIVRDLKPYTGGNKLLRSLHDLDITDKHKSLVPVAHYAGIKNFQMNGASGPMLTIQNLHCGPIRDGMVLMSLPPAGNVRIGQSFNPSLKLCLDEDVIERDEELVETMHKYVDMVEDILQRFKDLVAKENS